MEQSTTVNGSNNGSSTANTASKKPRKQRYLPSLPIASSAKDTNKATMDVLTSRSPIEFAQLENGEMFSTVDDGSDAMVKVSVSKAFRISDSKSFITGGGRVYRVRFTNYRPAQAQNQNQSDS
jgi:hypothetical protein